VNHSLVRRQAAGLGKRATTQDARVRFDAAVRPLVARQVARVGKRLGTHVTHVRPLAAVDAPMQRQRGRLAIACCAMRSAISLPLIPT